MSTEQNNVQPEETQVDITKLTKPDLIIYINKLVAAFNEQTTNYGVLYNEYQRLIAAPVEAGTTPPVKSEEFLALEARVPKLEQELEKLFKDYTDKLKIVGELTRENEELKLSVKEYQSNFVADDGEIKRLNEEIKNLRLEKSKVSSLKDINSLEKIPAKSNSVTVQTYEVFAYDNRVDNTEFYQGREFTIAKILVKLEDRTFSWTIDFIGSDLFTPAKIARMVVMDDTQYDHFQKLLNGNTFFNAIKAMLDIPLKFDPNIWFQSVLYMTGDRVEI